MPQPADIIISHARVFTANPANPHAEAVALRGRQIVFVGSNADAQSWRGSATRLIDGQNCTLMPGFIDSHFHLLHGSLKLGDIQLDQAGSLAELAEAIQAFAAARPNEPWLVGQGARYAALPNETLTRHQLDAIIANRPLVLLSYDVHTAWANTEALRRANLLTGGEPAGPNSQIGRDAQGQATGELIEPGAYNLVLNLIPPLTAARQKALLKQGLALAASLGITSVHNMDGDSEQLALYQSLEKSGELTLRVYVPFDVKPHTPPEALEEAVDMRQSCRGNMVRSGSVKFFMDGVIETYTGLLLSDYANRPGDKGGALFSAQHFSHMAGEADRLGLQIFVHAVGDGAVRRALDGFEAAQRRNGRRDSRHRIEHIELIHPADLPRFAQLGVVASVQPAHAPLSPQDTDPWPSRVGQARWADSFAWQSLRQAGARLAFGSDWPVATLNPMAGLYYALNRQPWLPHLPHHRQTLADALPGYTREAAYAEFQEHQKGQLRPGLLADAVLLSRDIFATPPEEIDQVQPVLTICNGQIVYEA